MSEERSKDYGAFDIDMLKRQLERIGETRDSMVEYANRRGSVNKDLSLKELCNLR